LALALAGAATAAAQSAPAIDGTADAAYGPSLSVQNTKTHFGDNNLGDLIATRNGGSEIDQVFGVVAGGRLYVTVTGNLERNFNKLEVYIDSKAGGVNTIDGANLPDQVDGFCCGNNAEGNGALQRSNGLTFDTGFDADYFLTFTHGLEKVGPVTTGSDRETHFWAMSAHYADLTSGTAGATASAGMQLGPQGRAVVLRFPFNSDFDNDSDADGSDFLIWQRNVDKNVDATRATGDANGDGAVNFIDLEQWGGEFGQARLLTDTGFVPNDTSAPTTALIGPTLPGLEQGQLIDKNYALGPGGGTGTLNDGLIAKELEFALPDDGNGRNRRNMENTIDLRMALDNSNIAGVAGSGSAPWDTDLGNPGDVRTGIEFSIPLEHIGNPTGNIDLTIFVNNGEHNYASNQFAGVGILDANPGGNGFGGFTGEMVGVNMNDFAGNQYVTVVQPAALAAVPEPAGALLVGAAVVGLLAARRRR
jgi:hypothetical protein